MEDLGWRTPSLHWLQRSFRATNWNSLLIKEIRWIWVYKNFNVGSNSVWTQYLFTQKDLGFALWRGVLLPSFSSIFSSGIELKLKGMLGSTERFESLEDMKKIFTFKSTTISGRHTCEQTINLVDFEEAVFVPPLCESLPPLNGVHNWQEVLCFGVKYCSTRLW